MKPLVLMCIAATIVAGCASTVSRRGARPVIREFSVAEVNPGSVSVRSDAEKVARAYFQQFDEAGSVGPARESRDRWIFTARAGDFSAEPVADIVVMKDGSMISQTSVGPRVRLTGGRWLYDFREVRPLLWSLDEKPGSHEKAEPGAPDQRP